MTKIEDKIKAVELAIAALDKQFGPNTVIHGDGALENVDVISTGNFELDLALGVGGLPKGRITEIYGGEGLGKTLIALNCAASCQAQGGLVAYIDLECDLNPDWATKLGVNIPEMYIAQPASGEEAFTVAETLIKTGSFDLVVFDSVAAMPTIAELEAAMDEPQVGSLARVMAKGLRKIREPLKQTNTCAIFINQIRDQIGYGMGGTTTPGGRSLKFAASVRIELKKAMGSNITNSAGESIGTKVKANIIKNKVGSPMKTLEWDNLHGLGFNNYGAILKLGLRYNMLSKSGAYWYMGSGENKADKPFAQGEQAAWEYLASDLELTEGLKKEIAAQYNQKQTKK